MAARFIRIATVCWLIALSAPPASANPLARLWTGTKQVASDIARDTKRRNCWPEPFIYPDRQAARAPFVTMIEHGWRQQNLIAYYHFREDSSRLTEAGRHKVRWILFEVAPQHRIIYVQTADDPQLTADRVAEVRQLATALDEGRPLPPVLKTHLGPLGWSSEWVDAVGRKFHEGTPAPALPPPRRDGEH